MKRSITTRLVLMFALATVATFTVIGLALYGVLKAELARHLDDELNTNLQSIKYSIERVDTMERWGRVRARMDTMSPSDGSVRFWLASADPRFRYGKDLDRVERMRWKDGERAMLSLAGHDHPLQTRTIDIPALQDRPDVRLTVGVDSTPFARTLRTFMVAMALLSLTATQLVMLMGYWIARVGLRPLQRLSGEAQALSPKTLSQRLPLAELPEELSDLAMAFNGALERLEGAYQQLEAFNADVAHELRTPLANMIGGTQVALSRQRSAEQFQEALQSNLEEMERLRSIVNDMLFLARADQGEVATRRAPTLIVEEVRKTIEFFEFVLDEQQMAVRIDGDMEARVMLESALFRRALSNLLQNAVEHSAPGARLSVGIRQEADAIWVTVSNPGSPIGERHLPRVFDRFYRVDVSRNDGGQRHGHGLGLAIVKAVARMHGGGVQARSEAGTTTVGFSLRGLPNH